MWHERRAATLYNAPFYVCAMLHPLLLVAVSMIPGVLWLLDTRTFSFEALVPPCSHVASVFHGGRYRQECERFAPVFDVWARFAGWVHRRAPLARFSRQRVLNS